MQSSSIGDRFSINKCQSIEKEACLDESFSRLLISHYAGDFLRERLALPEVTFTGNFTQLPDA